MGSCVTEAVLHELNIGTFPSSLNHTFIALIPKKKILELVADFRLISICNVLYKILSKVIANRLKVILPQIIFKTQSAFVMSHLIIDNVLIVYEILHFLR